MLSLTADDNMQAEQSAAASAFHMAPPALHRGRRAARLHGDEVLEELAAVAGRGAGTPPQRRRQPLPRLAL